jgi:serine phosphatase RsbU (regulator of sigma subunit)/DNA-binding response OmpR family regulator/anti-sigma regulatory factor (Ser/Thr protein kinase)
MAAVLSETREREGGARAQATAEDAEPAREGATQLASILLVDDDEQGLAALRAVLEPLGQRLVSARSGEEALRKLLHEEFAAILLDVRMPGIDGLQTARYIKARGRTRRIPILFLTAQAQDVEQVIHAYAAGAVDYVVKPYDPDVLRSKVSVFVELQRERAERVREARARAQAEAIAGTVKKLQSISDAALSHLQMDELLQELLGRATAVFEADAAGLLLVEESGRLRLAAALGLAPSEEPLTVAPEEGVLGHALLRPLRGAQEPEQGPRALPPLLRDSGLRSLIAAPLRAGQQALGVLFMACRAPARFGEEDLILLELSADRAAVAIEHARTYERQHGMVETLQRHLLPDRLPEAPGLALAARYRPSERAAQVGGDWYDAIALPGGRVGLAIGDVVGRGIPAATLMSELRSALRAYAVSEPESPAAALARLNSLVTSTHDGMVATLLYLVFETDATRARFASAGHLPPLLLGPDGQARYLEHPSAPPLGAVRNRYFENHELELDAQGTLLLYTDGLVERRGESINVGLELLRTTLASGPRELEQLCSHVLAAAAGAAEDDVAILAVRRLAEGAGALELELPAEPRSVPAARHRLERWLSETGGGVDDFAIKLAVSEACTNAVEHAYGPGGGHCFRLTAWRRDGEVVIEVADAGRWRAPRGAHRGRGITMMEEVMDSVELERTPAGTVVRMRKRGGDE